MVGLLLKDLGIRKDGIPPKERFDVLLKTGWNTRFSNLFGFYENAAINAFNTTHTGYLEEKHIRTDYLSMPLDHRLKHIGFVTRSFNRGWKSEYEQFPEFIREMEMEIDRANHSMPRPSTFHNRATMLYSLDFVLSFLENFKNAENIRLEFFKKLVENKILADPLFLFYMLNQTFNNLPGKRLSDYDLVKFAGLIVQNREKTNEVNSGLFIKHIFKGEEDIGTAFLSKKNPFWLGGRFAFYALDGQVGTRTWMLPDEISVRTVKNLASILMYGIVTGGIVGSTINHDQIYLSVDRVDIDLLNIYSDVQSAVVIPIIYLTDSGYPYSYSLNSKLWYEDDRAMGAEFRLEIDTSTNKLPHVPSEKLVAIVPLKLLERLQEELFRLVSLLGVGIDHFHQLCKRIISYDPKYWGSIHPFTEFLQLDAVGQRLIENVFGLNWHDIRPFEEIRENCGGESVGSSANREIKFTK